MLDCEIIHIHIFFLLIIEHNGDVSSDNQEGFFTNGYLQKTNPAFILYGCETWSLVLDNLRAFGKGVLRKTSDLPQSK